MNKENDIMQCIWHIRDALVSCCWLFRDNYGRLQQIDDLDTAIIELTKSLAIAMPASTESIRLLD